MSFWCKVRVTVAVLWVPFWCHFGLHVGTILGSILGSSLDHFGIILGHFGDLWATWDPLGAPWETRLDLGPRFEAFWGHFWDPLGTPWDTLGDPKEARRSPKALRRGLRRGSLRRIPKMDHLGPPSGEAQVSSRLDESTVFKVSGGSFSDPILAPFWSPFETQDDH